MAGLDFLGSGLLRPFQRDEKNDFAHGEAEALVRACVGQVLGTRCSSEYAQGELPWFTEFGSLLYRLRHQKNDLALQELARIYVVEALARWEPRIRVKAVQATRENPTGEGENALAIRLLYDVISENVSSNEVFIADVDQTVVV